MSGRPAGGRARRLWRPRAWRGQPLLRRLGLALALALLSSVPAAAAGAGGCTRDAGGGCVRRSSEDMKAGREAFAERCATECTSSGFQAGKVKETEVVGETVTRECWCASGGRLTDAPRFAEKGPR